MGSAIGLWRFPVKSMQGEELQLAQVSERGLAGDRVYALIDPVTEKVVSAKNPRKWPGILDWSATFVRPYGAQDEAPPPVRVVLPGGVRVTSDDPEFNARVSAALGREVAIRSTPPATSVLEEYWPDIDGLAHREMVTDETISLGTPSGTFFDFAAIHLLTTSTLRELAHAYPQGNFDRRRFRPNLLVETDQPGFLENEWIGRQIAVGGEVILKGVIPCPRCVMTTLPQAGLPADSGILRTAAQKNNVLIAPLQQNMPSVGLYAKVVHGGALRRGDPVRLI